MNSTFPGLITLLVLLGAPAALEAGSNFPSRLHPDRIREFPYRVTGIIQLDDPDWYVGSGTVAADPKIVVACAHSVYNDGRWLGGAKFAAAHHGRHAPIDALPLRGHWRWNSYTGGTDAQDFHRDFVVHYGFGNLASGAWGGWTWSNSLDNHPLARGGHKLSAGYPSNDTFYMNSIGSYTSRFRSDRGTRHFYNRNIRSFTGFSGGGTFVRVNDQWRLAGVNVSGAQNNFFGAGVRALDSQARDLINAAIRSANNVRPDRDRSFGNHRNLAIPDNDIRGVTRWIRVSDMPSYLTEIDVSVDIVHTWRGDLGVSITAPNNRTFTLHNRAGGNLDNLSIRRDLSRIYLGSNPNGWWRIRVADNAPADTGYLDRVVIDVTSR